MFKNLLNLLEMRDAIVVDRPTLTVMQTIFTSILSTAFDEPTSEASAILLLADCSTPRTVYGPQMFTQKL